MLAVGGARMSGDDPFDEEFEPVRSGGKRGKKVPAGGDGPDDPGEGAELDRQLAGYDANDLGNAKRLIARFGDRLAYVPNMGWHVYDGSRWEREAGEQEAQKLGDQVGLCVWREIEALKANPGRNPEKRLAGLYRLRNDLGENHRVRSMLAAAERYLLKPAEMFDAQPFLLAAPNGTIELGLNCEVRAPERGDYLTRRIAVPFETKGRCPRFEAFLERIMPDELMRGFLQRALGYCLTGSTRDQALFMFYGTGQNGKSTLVNVLRHIMGDYAMVSPISTFLAKREGGSGGEATPDLARLPGARLVTAAEPPEGARLDEGKIKEITGGEPIVARHLNQGFFTFKPVFKAIISTNHYPTIRGVDRGIWRRVRLVPFLVEIPDAEVDRDLESKLIEEAPAILQWLLTGVEEWRRQGLNPPDAAIAAVESYRADQDPAGEFLKDACVRTDRQDPATGRTYETSAKEVYAAYKRWCDGNGLEPMTARTFGTKLTGRGIERRKSNGVKMVVGVIVKATAVADPGDGMVER